jgi:HK97 family phage prohead protease
MKAKQRNRHQPHVRARYDAKSGIVRLNVPLSVKAETIDTSARTFEGLAATWDEDLGSDIIHKGAFKKSIAEWKSGSDAMPLLNSHDQFDIFSSLGQAVAMKETDEGLWTKWEILEGDDGDKVLARLRPSATTGRAIISKMSIGFIPTKFEFEQPEGSDSFWDRIRHINEANLKEVSLVLFPMNPGATIDASTVKTWLKMAHDADPRKLARDPLARHELRRLNSTIGLLLSKSKQEPVDDEEPEDEEDRRTPPSRKSSAPPKAERKDADDTGDDDEDLDDELEEDDAGGDDQDDGPGGDEGGGDDEGDEEDDDSDDESDEEEEDESDEPEQPKSEKPKHEKKKKEKEGAPADRKYEFGEALKQRITKLSLHERTSGTLKSVRGKS